MAVSSWSGLSIVYHSRKLRTYHFRFFYILVCGLEEQPRWNLFSVALAGHLLLSEQALKKINKTFI